MNNKIFALITILLIVVGAVGLSLGFWLYVTNKIPGHPGYIALPAAPPPSSTIQPTSTQPTNNNSISANPTSSANSASATDVKFTGTIQTVVNQQPVDGDLRIKVNGMWIIIGGGEMETSNSGVVIGFDLNDVQSNVGKTAEVYAKKTGYDQSLTILGNSKYYVKVIQ